MKNLTLLIKPAAEAAEETELIITPAINTARHIRNSSVMQVKEW